MLKTILNISLPLDQPVAIFLLVLVMILVTPVLLRRLGIPHIVGMILAGILVGPYGLGLLARDASFEIFGQVGILYLMFLAGVEIDMLGLQRNWRGGVRFGIVSFLLPMIGGLLAGRYLLGASWLTSALIASMLSSHTLISYPIVTRFGLSNTRASIVAVCGTIVSVLLALILLAEVISVKVHGGFAMSSLLKLGGSMIVYAAVIWWGFARMTRWFFRHFSDRVTQFIFILAEVLLASLLAQVIGLEAILGAFYAGLALNRFIPPRSGLMTRIEFVGNAIFIPYFLIGVGMLINVQVIFAGWMALWTAAVMCVTALVGKWIASFLSARNMGLPRRGRLLIFGLTSGKAAATIAATMIGYRYGLITEDIMNGSVIMILICCGVASVTTEKAAKMMRLDLAKETMEREGPEGRAVMARQLVAVANPMTAEGIMRLALLMRHPKNTHHVTGLFIRSGDDATSASMGKSALKSIVKVASSLEINVDEVERYDVNIGTGITNVSKEKDCTEIILGMHRKSNIVDTFFGPILEQLLRTSNKMVIMSRLFAPVNTLKRIVIIVPEKAEYETGFSLWLTRICMLAQQIGSKLLFIAYPDTIRYLQGAIVQMNFDLRIKFMAMHSWDDLITASGGIDEDDLLTVVCARKTSISYSADFENMPSYLSRYFSRHNLLMIYPEQFGPEAQMPTPIDPLSASIATTPGGWSWRSLFKLK